MSRIRLPRHLTNKHKKKMLKRQIAKKKAAIRRAIKRDLRR